MLFLVGFDVTARILLHPQNMSPVAASGLFAGLMLRRSPLALLVPLAAMLFSDLVIGFDDWRMTSVVYAALTLPALIGMLARRYRLSRSVLPAVLTGSLLFFVTTNFAVWALSGMYSADLVGLMQCYAAGLPFLKYTMAGDLLWAAVLFDGAFLVQHLAARKTSSA